MQFKKDAKPFIKSDDIEWEKLGEGIERKILGYDEVLMMVCVRFAKGSVGALHHHVHRQISYVESGIFEVTIDGEKRVLQKGDCFFCAARFGAWCSGVGARSVSRYFFALP